MTFLYYRKQNQGVELKKILVSTFLIVFTLLFAPNPFPNPSQMLSLINIPNMRVC